MSEENLSLLGGDAGRGLRDIHIDGCSLSNASRESWRIESGPGGPARIHPTRNLAYICINTGWGGFLFQLSLSGWRK